MFSTFFKEKRLALGMTLRSFCQTKGYDVAYISRIENALIQPPEDTEKLKALAQALGLKEQTTDWVTFFDLAANSKGKIPADIKENYPQVVSLLPAFYRSLRKKETTPETLEALLSGLASQEG